MSEEFNYQEAFARNIGFMSPQWQEKIRNTTIAIAGAGGAGSGVTIALARLGYGNFHIADLDIYEQPNFNRQLGATMSTVGVEKVAAMDKIIRDINPLANVKIFDKGISKDNIDQFLADVDVVVDALDFYCFKERMMLFPSARSKNLWVFTAPPLGFGCALLGFDPKGVTFEDYFGFEEDLPQKVWIERLLAGLAPDQHIMKYWIKEHIDFENGKLPSVGVGVFFLAGFVATEITKLVTRSSNPLCAPDLLQMDAMLGNFSITRQKSFNN